MTSQRVKEAVIDMLTEEVTQVLNEMVYEKAEEIAEAVVANNNQEEWLLSHQVTPEQIAKRVSELGYGDVQ